MIEQAMYFALGFLVAGLFMLLFLPAFWRRALRLSMRRLQALAPMSMEEVVAGRDLLRAQFAVRERRLEQEIEAIKASKAHDLVDIGRHAARIAEMDAQLARAVTYSRDVEAQLREAQKALAERTDLLSSTEAALLEMTERADRGVEQARRLESDKAELGRQTEMQLGRVAAHEAKIAALHTRGADLERDLEKLREEFAAASKEAARTPGLDAELARTVTERDSVWLENRAMSEKVAETRKKLAESEQRRTLETEQLQAALRLAREEARAAADRLETARADNAMLQGAVESLRKEHAAARQARAAALEPPLDPADVAALRREIVEIGARMEEMAGAPAERRVN